MPPSLKIQAAEELLRRREARRSLVKWANLCGFEPARHHLLLIEKLEALVNGTLGKKRLMVVMPPGSAKSTYASVLFPPWFLAQGEAKAILACSHSHTLVEAFGRRCRNFIDDLGQKLGFSLSPDSKAAGEWSTSNGGHYFCAGVGAGIAGRRADLGLIDDPIGSKEDANSKLLRDKQWDWYNFDFKPRLKPNALVVLIQTRWHEDDLAGRIIEREGEDWEIIRLPLIAEDEDALGRQPGELLWPEWFNDKMAAEAKADNQVFSSLYQGRPAPEEGNFFKTDMLQGYEPQDLPNLQYLRIYGSSDHAVSTKQTADKTCLLLAGVGYDGVVWILPQIFWDRAAADVVIDKWISLLRYRRPLTWWAEQGHISKSIGPFLQKRLREESLFVNIEEVRPSRDKLSRAQSIHARCSMGMVRFPKFASWWGEAEHELLSFPTGKHDDFVDALAHLGMGLDKMVVGDSIPSIEQELLNTPFRPTGRWLKEQNDKKAFNSLVESLDR